MSGEGVSPGGRLERVPLGGTGLAVSKLSLGTANFGVDYGYSKAKSQDEVDAILDAAIASGVTLIDTAPAYGDAEGKIGRYFSRRPDAPLEVATKAWKLTRTDLEEPGQLRRVLKTGVEASLRATRRERIALLQLHQAESWILESPELWDSVAMLLQAGSIAAFGASVYELEEGEGFLKRAAGSPVVVQAPFSLFDRRFARFAATAEAVGAGFVVRSVFVRGAASPSRSSVEANALAPYRAALGAIVESAGFSISEALLLFAASQSGISSVLVGVDSPRELESNANALQRLGEFSVLRHAVEALPVPSREFTDPRRWGLNPPIPPGMEGL